MAVDLMQFAGPDAAATPLRQLLRAGTTTPDRLRRVEAVLLTGCVVLAVLSVLGGITRSGAVHDSRTRIAALGTDSADLYQALADADAMAASGFVSGGLEPAAVRARYDADIARAGDRVTHAAGLLPSGDPAAAPVTTIAVQLPVYTSLVETARSLNRLALPLGQSYLGSASALMRSTILPAVQELRAVQSAALAAGYQRGGGIPFAVLAVGLAVLAGLIDLAIGERRRTRRVLSVGLLVAGSAVVAAVLWWAVAVAVADSRLDGARAHSDAAAALDEARTAVLQARSNESLVLVARSGGGGSSDSGFTAQLDRVLGPGADGGLLAAADPGSTGRTAAVRTAAQAWRAAHTAMRQLDDGGRYADAVASVTGTGAGSSGAAFAALDTALSAAVGAEREAFAVDIGNADGALTAVSEGPAVLVLLAAGGVVVGIGRRVGEYR